MRTLMAAMLLISLSACASNAGGPSIDGGVASYDAIKNAQSACAAKGGELVLDRSNSGQSITDYACKRK
jgi:putative hemolysin